MFKIRTASLVYMRGLVFPWPHYFTKRWDSGP